MAAILENLDNVKLCQW